MNKLLSALIVGLFALGTAVAADAPKPVDLKPAPAAMEAPKADAASKADAPAKPAKKVKKHKKSRKAKKAV